MEIFKNVLKISHGIRINYTMKFDILLANKYVIFTVW